MRRFPMMLQVTVDDEDRIVKLEGPFGTATRRPDGLWDTVPDTAPGSWQQLCGWLIEVSACRVMPKLDAVDRAKELLNVKRSQLPPLALEFCGHLCSEVGSSIEVILTAFAVYAQCVEHLPCADELYHPRPQDLEWFADAIKR